MTQYLPPNLLALFAPRDPLPFLPPADKLPHEKKTRGYIGVGNFLGQFEVRVSERMNHVRTTLDNPMSSPFPGPERHSAAHARRDARGAPGAPSQGEGRTGRLQAGARDRHLGSAEAGRLHRGPVQDAVRGAHRKL